MIHKIIQIKKNKALIIQIHCFQIIKLGYLIQVIFNQFFIKKIINYRNKYKQNSYNIQIEILTIQVKNKHKMKSNNH